jgi:hypothetical protein
MPATIGERSDAVLRTAMASESTPFFERLCAGMTERMVRLRRITLYLAGASVKRVG